MGATSSTGVGNGSAGPQRGPSNNRNQYASLLDPHVVHHGTGYIDTGSSGELEIPLPEKAWDLPENLTILLAGKAWGIQKNTNGAGLVTSFTISGNKKRDIDFVVVKSPAGRFIDGNYA